MHIVHILLVYSACSSFGAYTAYSAPSLAEVRFQIAFVIPEVSQRTHGFNSHHAEPQHLHFTLFGLLVCFFEMGSLYRALAALEFTI